MQKNMGLLFGTFLTMVVPHVVQAKDVHWNVSINVGNQQGSNRPSSSNQRPNQYPQQKPNAPRPPYPPHQNRPPAYSNGLSIMYQAPSSTTYNQNTYMWVNGDPNVAKIETSSYEVITNWQGLGLPAPPQGMYWIFENGRYALVPIK